MDDWVASEIDACCSWVSVASVAVSVVFVRRSETVTSASPWSSSILPVIGMAAEVVIADEMPSGATSISGGKSGRDSN